MAQGNSGFSDQEIARAVLQLDSSVTLWRRAASASLSDLAATAFTHSAKRDRACGADRTGAKLRNAIVEDQRFLPVLDYVAHAVASRLYNGRCGANSLKTYGLQGNCARRAWHSRYSAGRGLTCSCGKPVRP